MLLRMDRVSPVGERGVSDWQVGITSPLPLSTFSLVGPALVLAGSEQRPSGSLSQEFPSMFESLRMCQVVPECANLFQSRRSQYKGF